MPPETPDECPVCGVDVSVDLTVFCSVSCQVVALNRLDKAEADASRLFHALDRLMNQDPHDMHDHRPCDSCRQGFDALEAYEERMGAEQTRPSRHVWKREQGGGDDAE